MNAALEITGGMLILFGFFTRLAALVMGAHLALIALSLGHTEIAVRDWGLAFAFFGLALAGGGAFTLGSLLKIDAMREAGEHRTEQ